MSIIGRRFNRWTVIGITERLRYVQCQCDCGKIKEIHNSSLYTGTSKSCGCLRVILNAEQRAKMPPREWEHPLYPVHRNMISRCTDPKSTSYRDYGARGIDVCDEWRSSFVIFREWALSHGYQKGLQIDRRDNDGNYEPSNCRFVTQAENALNKRNTVYLTAFGETKMQQAWLRDPRCVVNRKALYMRLSLGWNVETALTLSTEEGAFKFLVAFGERKTLKEWSRDPRCVVTYKLLSKRIIFGHDPEVAITAASTRGIKAANRAAPIPQFA